VGAGYIERNWPDRFKATGACPLGSLRQGSVRLVDPDAILRSKIVEFVGRGDVGLASGAKPGGTYERVWFREAVGPDEVALEADVLLLHEATAEALKAGATPVVEPPPRCEV
jgi:hypothetical protein